MYTTAVDIIVNCQFFLFFFLLVGAYSLHVPHYTVAIADQNLSNPATQQPSNPVQYGYVQ